LNNSFAELKKYLASKSGMRMAHVYKPVMLLAVLRHGGSATKEQIARDFVLRDQSQIDFYRKTIVHKMPGSRLVRDGLLSLDNDTYSLSGLLSSLTIEQQKEIEEILEERISSYLGMRNPYGDNNLDAVPGSIRQEVLKRAKQRCELCGRSAKDMQIDADHIRPRSKGGSNDITNLQALCRTCNAEKGNRDDEDFRGIAETYEHRDDTCPFCSLDRELIAENELAVAFRDGFPVTPLHTLVIPKRHIADYFDLYQPEINAMNQLLAKIKDTLIAEDASITGFNIGINSGQSAGQTIFHCHVHLIPRRDGDVEDPRGGVRGVIAAKQRY
jgi:ATP adenylyltransferase